MDSRFLLIRLAAGVVARPWNGNDEKGRREHHGFIPKKDNPKDIALYWRTEEKAPRRYIGTYRLDLTELLNAGYIRTDSYRGRNGFRVKFVHAQNDCIYLQKDSDSTRLIVGVFE
jgi:hypothetical protein